MIVFLDTTVLLSDVAFRGTAWRVLAQAAPAWDIRICVPEVAIIEARAGYQRRTDEARSGLESWKRKYANRLGLVLTLETTEAALTEAKSSYPARLAAILKDLDATIISPPAASHITLVTRAANRRPPCDDQGDGYRDTLNWITLLNLAVQYPDEQISWISDNARDFGSEGGSELHHELRAELSEVHAEDRVFWFRNLKELVITLAAKNAIEGIEDLTVIQEQLREQLLKEFIADVFLSMARDMSLDARECGLPLATAVAKVASTSTAEGLDISVLDRASIGESMIEFKLEADTTIHIELPADVTSEDLAGANPLQGIGSSSAVTTKILRYTGLMKLDGYGRPSDAEIVQITALDDDPGRLPWAGISTPDSSQIPGGKRSNLYQLKSPEGAGHDIHKWLTSRSAEPMPNGVLFVYVIMAILALMKGKDDSPNPDDAPTSENESNHNSDGEDHESDD